MNVLYNFFLERFIELFYIMSFHKEYSDLINRLPPSLVQESWRQLTSRKRNPLSIEEIQSINPIVEAFLKHEIEVYNQKKTTKTLYTYNF